MKCELGMYVGRVSLPRMRVWPQPTRSTLPTNSVLPVRKHTMSPGVKGSLNSSSMPPRKFAAMSRADRPIARPPTPPKARVLLSGTLRKVLIISQAMSADTIQIATEDERLTT
jgi:hypothetical protein